MISIAWTLIGTKWGKIIAACLAGLLVLSANNAWQRSKGRKQVVQASHKAGIKRNEKSDKIRARIVPGTAWKRLQSEFADGR